MNLVRYIAGLLDLLHRCNSPCFELEGREQEEARHLQLGAYGEAVACSYLKSRGAEVLRRNWTPPSGSGEIDIVARDGNKLCFVEVKSRESDSFARPARAVDADKRNQIRKGAREWLRLLGHEVPVRFDIVEVVLEPNKRPRILWTRGAFEKREIR